MADELARWARQRGGDPTARAVRAQLLEDFDPALLGWVLAAEWSGPTEIPVSQFDLSGRAGWKASRDGQKVDSFAAEIAAGRQVKPVVAVKEPGKDALVVVDGHHRLLAYERAGLPVLAYVGYVSSAGGPWETIHARQREDVRGSSLRGDNTGVISPVLPGRATPSG